MIRTTIEYYLNHMNKTESTQMSGDYSLAD